MRVLLRPLCLLVVILVHLLREPAIAFQAPALVRWARQPPGRRRAASACRRCPRGGREIVAGGLPAMESFEMGITNPQSDAPPLPSTALLAAGARAWWPLPFSLSRSCYL